MGWVIGTVVVLVVLVVVARRRNRRDPSYDGGTLGRIDDHMVMRNAENMHDRFGGGQV